MKHGLVMITLTLSSQLYADSLDRFAENFPLLTTGIYETREVPITKRPELISAEIVNKYHYDRNRIKVDSRSYREWKWKKKIEPSLYVSEAVYLPDSNISMGSYDKKPVELISFYALADPEWLKNRWVDSQIDSFFNSSILYCNQGKTIAEVMRSSKYTITPTMINEVKVDLIETNTHWGHFKLWVDPKQSCLPIKLIVEKSAYDYGRHYLDSKDEKLKDHVWLHPDGTKRWDVNLEIEIQTKRISQLTDQKKYLSHYTVTTRSKNNLGENTSSSKEIQVLKVQPMTSISADNFKFSLPIPKNVTVTANDTPQIKYEWKNGKIVKSIDQPKYLQLTMEPESQPEPSTDWKWILLASLFFATILLAYKMRK